MSRKTTSLSELKTRRQLLIVESELNRAQMGTEWLAFREGVHHWSRQVRAVGSMATSAVSIGSNVGGFFRGLFHHEPRPAAHKPSVISTVFKGARAGFSIWNSIRQHLK